MTCNFKILLTILLVTFFGSRTQAQQSTFKSIVAGIQSVQKQLAPDKRVAVLEVSLEDTLQPVVKIKGETNLPDGRKQILQLFDAKGIRYVDSIRLLPTALIDDKTWGLASLSASNLRTKPDHAAELASQVLMGTPMKILDYVDGWYRVQTPDFYIGWMDSGGLARFTGSEMDRWKKSNRYVFNQITGNAFDSTNRKKSKVSDLVLGDLFEVEAEIKGYLKIRFPDGRTGFVKKKDCLSFQEWTSRKPDVQSVLGIAKQLLGVPYLWGGTSCKAVDCSGFTKTAYYSQGIILARDASQQAKYGKHPGFNEIGNLQPGDLLFFGRSDQRVTHVGIYLENGWYIHASSAFGRVHVNSIDPKNQEYVLTEKKKLVAASRILNSLNTEGIVLVKDHPWYK
jgi:SH3-like domain-containing protein